MRDSSANHCPFGLPQIRSYMKFTYGCYKWFLKFRLLTQSVCSKLFGKINLHDYVLVVKVQC